MKGDDEGLSGKLIGCVSGYQEFNLKRRCADYLRNRPREPRDFYRINPQSLLWREGQVLEEDHSCRINLWLVPQVKEVSLVGSEISIAVEPLNDYRRMDSCD